MIFNILIYFLLSFLVLLLSSKISYYLKFVVVPNKRKMHLRPVAYTGGVGICLIYICAIYLFNFSTELNLILSISFLITIVGFVDDRYNLNPGGKLCLQILPIFYLITLENFNLNNMGNYDYFILKLNTFSIPFTLIAVLFLINSFNYFDGLDGVLSFTSISTLGILFFLTSDENVKLFLIIILIPILIFLFFNFSIFRLPKLFLGDNGSLLLGFVIAFTLIYMNSQKIIHPILLAFSISIFTYEFLSINFIRLKYKKNIFTPGQDHLHHILFKYTNSIFLTNTYIFFSNIIIFIIGYTSFLLIGPFASFIIFIILFVIFLILRKKYQL